MKIQLETFVMQDLLFTMKLLEFMSKTMKILLTELVGQSSNILLSAFSALTCQTEKATGNIFLH